MKSDLRATNTPTAPASEEGREDVIEKLMLHVNSRVLNLLAYICA